MKQDGSWHEFESPSAQETETAAVTGQSLPPGDAATTGSTVSRYVVLDEVGRGGMGRVLRAYDPKLQREVALKEVRRDALGEEMSARLVAEARAMAKLTHPNVVGVYDVEELDSGEVVLVMEYVRGTTLKRWLAESEQPWQAVLGRFIAAGRGLLAAHHAGLLHRDFKPANVLVGDEEATKVTDFGLAKGVTDSNLDEIGETMQSGGTGSNETHGGLVMGTPRYMAPEQHAGEELTEAVDQYALCVALWEALCKKPPFSSPGLQTQKLDGPPRWTNARVPGQVVDAIRRGLAPRPEDRWPSLASLLDALAWDPARRRNQWLLAGTGAAIVAVCGVSWQAWASSRAQLCTGAPDALAEVWNDDRRAEVEGAILGIGKHYAEPVWERSRDRLDSYGQSWVAIHRDACEATTVRKEQSTEVLDLRMRCLLQARVELGAVVDVLTRADDKTVGKAHELIAGLPELRRCSDPQVLREGVDPPRLEDEEAVASAQAMLAKAKAQVRAAHFDAANTTLEEVEQLLEGVSYEPVRIDLAVGWGNVLGALGRYEEAEAALEGGLKLAINRADELAMAELSILLLHVVGFEQQRSDEALMRYRLLAENLAPDDPRVQSWAANNISGVLRLQGKYEEAEAQIRRAVEIRERTLEPDDLLVVAARNSLANVLHDQGRFEEAEQEVRWVLEVRQRVLGPEHPEVGMARNTLANVLEGVGRYEEALAEFRGAREIYENAFGPEHPDVAMVLNNVAVVLEAQGNYDEAESEYRRALATWERALGPEHPNVGVAYNNIGNVLVAQDRFAQAEAAFRKALEIWEPTLGPTHPNVGGLRANMGALLEEQGKYEEAEREYRRALSVQEQELGPDHPLVTSTLVNLARVLFRLGRPLEAVEPAERAWLVSDRDSVPAAARASTAFAVARARWQTADSPAKRRDARKLAEQALVDYEEAGAPHREARQQVQDWLASHR